MRSYVGMAMVKKEQGQDDYFSQKSIFLTFYQPTYRKTQMFHACSNFHNVQCMK